MEFLELVKDFVMTTEEFNSVLYGAILKAEVVDLVGFWGEVLPEEMEWVAVVLVLLHKCEDHALLFFIVLGIDTCLNQINLLNIKVQLGNYLEHFFPIIFS